MFRNPLSQVVWVVFVMLFGVWTPSIMAVEKAPIIPDKALPDNSKKRVDKQPRAREIIKPTDLAVNHVFICPIYSNGPYFTAGIRNNGPNIAYSVKVYGRPGTHGLQQDSKIRKIKIGETRGSGLFSMEGGDRIKITVEPGRRNTDTDPGNNTCVVRVPVPGNEADLDYFCTTVRCF